MLHTNTFNILKICTVHNKYTPYTRIVVNKLLFYYSFTKSSKKIHNVYSFQKLYIESSRQCVY